MEEMWKEFQARPSSSSDGTTMAAFSLTLNSDPLEELRFQQDHDHQDGDDQYQNQHQHHDQVLTSTVSTPAFMNSLDSPFEALAVASSSVSLFSCLLNKNKRPSEQDRKRDDSDAGDPRLKRRMKNRESAARSRARRQAYTSELERELAQLTEENTKLREQQQKLVKCASREVPKKRGHMRSLTAPF